MQITKQQAGLLYGNSYLLQHVESGEIYRITCVAENGLYSRDTSDVVQHIALDKIGSTYKILARRNDLAKIIVDGVEINLYKKMWLSEVDLDLVNIGSKTADLLRSYNYKLDLPKELVMYNDDVYNS